MKALLDTHVFLWWNDNSPKLTEDARKFIEDGENDLFVSVATAWEIAIKYRKGHLELPEPPEKFVPSRIIKHGFIPLPIELTHAVHVRTLPLIHGDPFDHLLIAQCQIEELKLITKDGMMSKYDVEIVW